MEGTHFKRWMQEVSTYKSWVYVLSWEKDHIHKSAHIRHVYSIYFVICFQNEFTCEDCPDGYTPNANLTSCVHLPVLHLDWDSLWVLLPVSVSTIGMLAAVYVIYVFVKFNNTPLIMASGRELCYVLLCGIFMSYGTTFILLARPGIVMCTVKRFMLGISLCLMYAAVLIKTNRIYRIFNRGIKAMVKKPSYTSPRSQILICLGLVSVQVVGGLTWVGFEKPEIMYEKHYTDFLVLTCKASQTAILLSLVYNMLLIILCTVFGFKTRKIPQNFNEAKYIAFTMYSTCIVWLAFIPIYFGANHDFKVSIGCNRQMHIDVYGKNVIFNYSETYLSKITFEVMAHSPGLVTL